MIILRDSRITVGPGAELLDNDGEPIGTVDAVTIVGKHLVATGTLTTDRHPTGIPKFAVQLDRDVVTTIETIYASSHLTIWWDDPRIGFQGDIGAIAEREWILASLDTTAQIDRTGLIRPGSPTRHE